MLILDGKPLRQKGLDGFPLVVAEVVNYHEEHFLAIVHQWEDVLLHHILGQGRACGWVCPPVLIVLSNELGERLVGLNTLHT